MKYNETFANNEENLIKIVGTIHNEPGKDVLNEIDVLSLKGKVVLFISCKTGKMYSNRRYMHSMSYKL